MFGILSALVKGLCKATCLVFGLRCLYETTHTYFSCSYKILNQGVSRKGASTLNIEKMWENNTEIGVEASKMGVKSLYFGSYGETHIWGFW